MPSTPPPYCRVLEPTVALGWALWTMGTTPCRWAWVVAVGLAAVAPPAVMPPMRAAAATKPVSAPYRVAFRVSMERPFGDGSSRHLSGLDSEQARKVTPLDRGDLRETLIKPVNSGQYPTTIERKLRTY